MSDLRYNVDNELAEHRFENRAKAVDNYGWDAENLQWVRTTVKPDGTPAESLPTAGNNPSETITETLVGSVLTTVIQKVISGTTYTKTIVENYTTGVTTETAWS